ncbi:MAG TPA: tRNA (cytidine(34)-2'-O)-methyltransferase [Victivallales bacterium]|nr:tRNA (cytidine(34)-2'-O)-methyltransferase [Victivallales bacterium]
MFNIALIAPEIPQNTGNIGRLCVNNDCKLHLVRPLGFSLDDRYIKRAGLDYWKYLELKIHENTDEFIASAGENKVYIFSSKAETPLWDCPFEKNSFLVFGNESSGLPRTFHSKFKNSSFKIPMLGKHARTINLANAVAISLYEGIRKNLA